MRSMRCRLGWHRYRIDGRKVHVHIGSAEVYNPKPWKCSRCGKRSEGQPGGTLGSL